TVVPDPANWPDPATASTEPASHQQPQPQPAQPAPKKQGKKGKDKWTPLDAEINYTKPKGVLQSASGPQRQPRQNHQSHNQKQQKSQQGQQSQQKQQNGNINKSATVAAAKVADNSSGTGGSKAGNAAKKASQADGDQTAPKQAQQPSQQEQEQNQDDVGSRNSNQHGRSQRQSMRGRGRGRGLAQNASYGRRGGHRIAGHAPSHYQGKGNVQTGPHVAVPMPQPVVGDEESVKSFVRAQIEYYFSVDNLCKDIFFRTQMDPD
ncbi:hypothetical protein GGI23_007610, partial [Coemansia sp. RSA 2559]